MLSSKDLELVNALCRLHRMADAASVLGMHHSTLFRQLAHLEGRLGYPLFTRAEGRYHPTPAAENIQQVAQEFEDRLGALEHKLSSRELAPEGTVRLTTTDTVFYGLLTRHLPAFQAAHPAIRLEIDVENRFRPITRREADIALRPSNRPPENLAGRKIGLISSAIYVQSDRLKQADWLELSDMPWIGPDETLSHLGSAQWLRDHPPKRDFRLTVNSLYAAFQACREGLGAAILPCFLGDPCQDLTRAAAPDPAWGTELWLLTHPDLRHSPRIRAVMDFIGSAQLL